MAKRARSDSTSSDTSSPADRLAVVTPEASLTTPSPQATSRQTSEEPSSKYVQLDSTSSSALTQPIIMRCHLPPHPPLTFTSYTSYETHYTSTHTHRCLSPGCNKNFPTAHYLDLHISENHDPIAEARRERGEKTYQCFVEGCEKVCSSPFKRRLHCVDKHCFPREYDFFVVNEGLEGRRSMLRPQRGRRRSSVNSGAGGGRNEGVGQGGEGVKSSDGTGEKLKVTVGEKGVDEVEREDAKSNEQTVVNRVRSPTVQERVKDAVKPKNDVDVDDITKSMSSLKFVPPSIRFGRGGARGGFARR